MDTLEIPLTLHHLARDIMSQSRPPMIRKIAIVTSKFQWLCQLIYCELESIVMRFQESSSMLVLIFDNYQLVDSEMTINIRHYLRDDIDFLVTNRSRKMEGGVYVV
jgi:hypothetical protein